MNKFSVRPFSDDGDLFDDIKMANFCKLALKLASIKAFDDDLKIKNRNGASAGSVIPPLQYACNIVSVANNIDLIAYHLSKANTSSEDVPNPKVKSLLIDRKKWMTLE